MGKKTTYCLLVCLLGGGVLFAKKFWMEKNYLEWSQKETMKILTNSPWNKVQSYGMPGSLLGGGGDSGGSTSGPPQLLPGQEPIDYNNFGRNPSRKYFVRFLSAVPIRMALARRANLQGSASVKQVEQFVQKRPFDGRIVVNVLVDPPAFKQQFEATDTETLKDSTYLLLKKSKRKIYLEEFLPPSKSNGFGAIFLFPRTENDQELVKKDQKDVLFRSKVDPRTELDVKFKLKDMVFQGELEI